MGILHPVFHSDHYLDRMIQDELIPHPTLDWQFARKRNLTNHQGRGDLSFSGADNGTFHDHNLVLQDSGADQARFHHIIGASLGKLIEPGRTNSIENNTMVGSATGTPGDLPVRWLTLPRTTTQTIVEVDIIKGINYIDLKFTGTPDNDLIIWFEDATIIDALTSEDWTISAYLALIGGDFTNIDLVALIQSERTEAGGFVVTNSGADLINSLTATMQRFEGRATLNGGGTVAHLQPGIVIRHTSGAVDFTLRIGLPQEEKGKSATSVIKTINAGTVTRPQDIGGTTDLSWYNRPHGTIRAEFSRPIYTSGLHVVAALQVNGSSDTGIEINTQLDGIFARVDFNRASGLDVVAIGEAPIVNQPYVMGFAWAKDNLLAVGNGKFSVAQWSDDDTQGELATAGVNILNFGFGEGQSVIDPLLLQRFTCWDEGLHSRLQMVAA